MMSETLVTYTTCLVEFAGAKYLQTCTYLVFSVMPYLVSYLIFEYLTYQNIGYINLYNENPNFCDSMCLVASSQ